MSSNDRKFSAAARSPQSYWSPADLNVEQLSARAGSTIAARGRAYYAQKWRLRVQRVGADEAVVRVQGSRRYEVEFWRDGNRVLAFCDCPYAEYDEDVVCKHIVAAALFLRDSLAERAPVPWVDVLSQAVRAASSRTPKRTAELLFFSLQARGSSWVVLPYTVAASFFPEAALHDAAEAARVVTEQRLSSQAEKVSPYESNGPRVYPNVTRAQAALVRLLASAGLYYAGTTLDFGVLFALLAGGPLFSGTDKNPLKRPLEVCMEPAHIELELARTKEGCTRLSALAVVGARTFLLQGRDTQIVSNSPLWLLSGETLLPLDASPEIFALFRQNPTLDIPEDEEQTFFEQHLPHLAEQFPLRGEAVRWEELRDARPVPRLYLTEAGKELRVELRYGYGGHELSPSRNAVSQSIRRNAETGALVLITRQPAREQELWETIGSKTYGLKRASANYDALRGSSDGLFLLRANTHPFDFLLRHVPQLAAAGCEIYGEAELNLARINRNRPTISFGVTSGIDWFDVQAVVQFGDVEVALAEVRRAVRKRERFIKLADGSIGEIPPEWIEQYRHLFALGEETDKGLRLAHHHLTLLDQLLAHDERARTDKEFQRRRERLRDFAGIKPQKLPRYFNGELRPYQKAGFDWLHFLREYNFGGCLADDMGTGKTILTLAFLQSLKERGLAKRASLLVVPRSLVFNWEREAARFTPRLQLLNHAGAVRAGDVSDFDDYDLVLTTYGLLRRDIEMLLHYEFNYLILDEAQAIKNPLAETAKAVRLLRGAHRLTLTGTPVENNTLELWSQFAFLNPGLLGNAEYFREEFSTPIEHKGNEQAAQFLRKMIYPFILRRTKDQVARDLPPRTERQMVCDMEPAQRKLYNEKRDYYRALLLKLIEDEGINNARFRVLEGLLRLRQICNHPRLAVKTFRGGSAKFELLLETLETLRAEGHKALVFSQFVGMLKILEAELVKRDIPFAYLDGQTRDRQQRVDAFQQDPAIPFFLISLKAGGVGLNLTAADYVIHVDPWWNPAVEMQATDRTHRIGQDKPVFIYKLVVRDSVEEKILQLQERKRALVTQLIATERSFFKSLTADDVTALFS